MPGPVSDRIQETTTTTGTGDVTLAGAVTGFLRFQDAFAVAALVYYTIWDGGANWEVGLGTLSGATTLQRTAVLASSNAGALVSFAAGTKNVWNDAPASLMVGLTVSPSQITGNQNNYNPTGTGTAGVLRINSDARRTLTGLATGYENRVLTIHNVGTFPIVFSYEDTNSSAENRFSFGTTLGGGQSLRMQYDMTSLRWRGLTIPEPVGTLKDFGGSTLPGDGLACDASAVSRTTYASLFNEIGTTWGTGNGSTTFNLPDFRRRVAVGSGGSSSGTLGNTVGSTGGAEDVALSTANLAAHTHTGTTGNNSVGHTHSVSGSTGGASADHYHSQWDSNGGGGPGVTDTTIPSNSDGNVYQNTATTGYMSADHSHSFSVTSGGISANHTHSFTSDSTGSGTAHNNMQPSAVVTKYIKYC